MPMLFNIGTDAAQFINRKVPLPEIAKTFNTPETTGFRKSIEAKKNSQADDYNEVSTTERFSPLLNEIQGIYPGTVTDWVGDFRVSYFLSKT